MLFKRHIIFPALLVFCCYGLSAQMSGSYTIGSIPSDFGSLQIALDSAVAAGINGSVSFIIKDGTYSEQTNVRYIPGASDSNTVSIRALNPGKVRYQFSAGLNNNFILKIDSASHLIISDIEFTVLNSNYGRIIDMGGGSHHNIFRKLIFNGSTLASDNDQIAIFYSGSGKDTANIIDSSVFNNGSQAIWLSSSDLEKGNIIRGNRFINQYDLAINTELQNALVVEGNFITSNSTQSIVIGIRCGSSTGRVRINRNHITYKGDAFCILFNAFHADTNNEAIISNNFIHCGGNTAAIGIFIETSSFLNIYNNNINLTSTTLGSAGRCINIQDINGYAGDINIFNNILVNRGRGYGLITFSTTNLKSDYNCFYTPSAAFGYWNGLATNALATWWLYTSQDSNSLILDPQFYSETDLHVANTQLDSTGLSLTYITEDFDGESRHPVYPDIGADEFTIHPLDIGIVSIPSPSAPCNADSTAIIIEVKNFGTGNIQSFHAKFSVNGQLISDKEYFDTIVSGASATVNLGNYAFYNDSLYQLSTEVYAPNGSIDGNPQNNILVRNIKTAVSDTFIIDIGGNGDFTSFNDAIRMLTEAGICGPVSFIVKPGLYIEQVSINDINGLSAVNTLSFIGERTTTDSVVLSFTSVNWYANFTLKISASHLRFHGIDFVTEINSLGKVVEVAGQTSDLYFFNNTFRGIAASSASREFCLVNFETDNTAENSIIFDSNRFYNGSYAVWISSHDAMHPHRKLHFKDNLFLNQYANAVYAMHQREFLFKRNTVISNTNYTAYAALFLIQSHGNHLIMGNNFQIHRGRSALYLQNCQGSAGNEGLIANNFIYHSGSNVSPRSVFFDLSSYQKFYYNTVSLNNTINTSVALDINSNSSYIWIINNQLVNFGTGLSISAFGTNNVISDYNNLYTKGINLGYWGGNRSNLSAWQSSSGQDSHSLSVEPIFFSLTDLHCLSIETDSAGTPLPEVSTDIDGEARNPTHPDIGADEYHLPALDAALLSFPAFETKGCDGNRLIEITLQNMGVQHLDSISFILEINNEAADSFQWKGRIPYRQKETIQLRSYTFSADSLNNLHARIITVNGGQDENQLNDSLFVTELNLIPRPLNLQVINDTVCYGEEATISVYADRAFQYRWYDAPVRGKLLGNDSFFITDKLYETSKIWVEAGSIDIPDSLKTNYTPTASNLTNGNMFDVAAIRSDIVIDSFDIHTQYDNFTEIYIFYRKGGFVGYENTSYSWIPVDTVTVKANGFGKPTRVSVGGIHIPQGEVYGIYISTVPVSFLHFSSGSEFYSNSDIAVYPGIALDYLFDAQFSVAGSFNGQIYYSTGSYCKTERVEVPLMVRSLPVAQLPADTHICLYRSIILDGGNNESYQFLWTNLNTYDTLSTSKTAEIWTSGTIRLDVYDGCGNKASATSTIRYAENPEAAFSLNDDKQCLRDNLFIAKNQSTVFPDTPLSYLWFLDSDSLSKQQDPQFSVDSVARYKLSLVATSTKGCKDTINMMIEALPMPEAAFEVNEEVQCLNENTFIFNNLSAISSGELSYKWDFDDSSTDSSHHPSKKYNEAGIYETIVSVVSEAGCADTANMKLTVKPNPVFTLGNDTTVCAGKSILLVPGFDFDEYMWSNDSDWAVILVDTNNLGLGTFLFWVRVGKDGCYATDSINITFVLCTSMEEKMSDRKIRLYPNPSDGNFSLEIDEKLFAKNEKIYLDIVNSRGQVLKHQLIDTEQRIWVISASDLISEKGLYYLVLRSENKKYTIRFLIQ